MAITKLNSLAIPPDTIVESDLSYPLTNFSSTGIDDNATSTAITIDSSQNVGISRTPSAWASSLQVTQNGVQGLWTASTGQNSSIGSNLYYDSSVQGRYITDGEAAQYQHFQGTHRWYNAPSGTAGALINGTGNLTQLARLDSDGLKFGSDSAAANALDDYEEGTWNVTLGDGTTTSGTLTTGRYTKIGQVVIARFDALNNINTAGFGTNQNVHISLPFTSSSTGRSTGSVIVDSIDFNSRTSVCSKVPDSTSNALLTLIGSNLGDGAVKWSYLSSGASDIVDFCLVYTA